MTTRNEISALVFGLNEECSERYWGDVPDVNIHDIFKGLDASHKTLEKTPGVHSTFFYIDIDNKASIEELKEVIKNGDVQRGGRAWDTVCIGWGVRGCLGLTTHFESLVNYVVGAVPGTILTFTAKPTGHLETFSRHFPQLEQK